jgi:hypothetical protein
MDAHPLDRRSGERAALVIGALVLLAALLPTLAGFASQGEGWRFMGASLGIEDSNSYLGKMRLGAAGAWDFSLFYTTEPHDAVALVFLPYLAAGRLVSLAVPESAPGHTLALILAFHIFRAVTIVAYMAVLWRFICRFAAQPGARVLAFVLALAGGGLGLLAPALGLGDPPELYIPEGFSPLVLLTLPHVSLSRAFMLAGLLCFFHALQSGTPWRSALAAGLCWVVVGLCVPFYLAVLYAVLGAWGLAVWLRGRRFPWPMLRLGLIAAAPTLTFFAWYLYAFSANPAFAVWSAQNLLPSPSPLAWALAYCLLAIPAAYGAREAWRRAAEHPAWALLAAWPLAAAVLVYLPISVQRRMSEGVIVPLALLAGIGLARWAGARPARRLASVGLALLSLSPAALLAAGAVLTVDADARPLFRPEAEARMMAWLNAQAAPGAVVLAAPETGNVLPAAAHVRPVMGHGPETLEWPRKTLLVRQFFGGAMTDVEARALLDGGGCLESAPTLCGDPVDYIVFGPLEQDIFGRGPAGTAPDFAALGFALAYDEDGYQVWARANRLPP